MKSVLTALITVLIALCFHGSLLASASSGDVPSAERVATPEEIVKIFYPDTPDGIDSFTGLRNEVSPCLSCFMVCEGSGEGRAILSRFTKPLANFFLKELEAAPEDPIHQCLDFDPIVDGQDYAITEFRIEPAVIDGREAKVTVRFLNFDTPTTIIFHLLKNKNDNRWLIDDIEGQWYKLKDYVTGCESYE